MRPSPRFRNFVNLVRSQNFRYVAGYYLDRIRVRPMSFARSCGMDLKYARRLLYGDMPSRFAHIGARAVHHTNYDILDLIFSAAEPRADDVLVDVGSGKGRVIIYWLHKQYGKRIVGLELDPDLAKRSAKQFRRFSNVQIIAGDAIVNVPEDGTFFYLYNPFAEDKIVEFERRVAAFPQGHRVRVAYYNPNFLDAFPAERWTRDMIQLNGALDRGTLKRFCFPVAILDRVPPAIQAVHRTRP